MRGLKKKEMCPIHNKRYGCCGRAEFSIKRKARMVGLRRQQPPVQRIDDPHHPRGYREICNEAEKRKRKGELLRADPSCYLCGKVFTDYREAELEHKTPQPAGCDKDDHRDNLGLACRGCNSAKGSKRL